MNNEFNNNGPNITPDPMTGGPNYNNNNNYYGHNNGQNPYGPNNNGYNQYNSNNPSNLRLDIESVHKIAKVNVILMSVTFLMLIVAIVLMATGTTTIISNTSVAAATAALSITYIIGSALLFIDIALYIAIFVVSIILIVKVNSLEKKHPEFLSVTLHMILLIVGIIIFPLLVFIDSCLLMSRCNRALSSMR